MTPPKRLVNLEQHRADKARSEMREELEFHIQERTRQLIARGMTPQEARAEAIKRLGNALDDASQSLGASATHKEKRLEAMDRLHSILSDIQFAVRGLVKRPGFAATAILTLALGIGANTAIYSAVDALLLRSLPYREPGRLMDIVQSVPSEANPTEFFSNPWSYPKYTFYKDAQQSFATIALRTDRPVTLTGTDPERAVIEEVTSPYLGTLGISPIVGSDMPAEVDAGPGARKVALITDALWQRRFNADPATVGKAISINNEPWEIVGVLPPGFRGLSGQADVIVNLTARPADDLIEPWSLEFRMIGRLKEGVTPEQATAEARALGPRIYEAYPMEEGMLTSSSRPQQWTADARPLDTIRVADGLRTSLLILFGAVGLVLLIACVNLANLLIARAIARRQEIGVRLAIGAGKGRLARLLVTESLVLAMLGGLAGLAVAWGGTRILSAMNPQDTLRVQGLQGGIGAVGFEQIRLDTSALLFAFGTTVVVGILFGLAPALKAARTDVAAVLKDGSAAAGASRHLGVSRRTLVVSEVALALVLLVAAGLTLRSLGKLLNVDPGFESSNVLTLRMSVTPGQVAPDSMPGYYDGLLAAIAAVPGVEKASLADCPPLNNGCNGTIFTFPDREQSATGNKVIGVHWVSPDWFETMRVPLKRGRMFTEQDRIGTPKVVLINEEAARRYFAGEDPIGRRVGVYQGGFDSGAEVIGIVGDVRYGTVDSTAGADAYISYGQARLSRMMIFVRTAGDPSAMVPSVRAAIRAHSPRNPIYDIQPMSSRVASATAQSRFSAVLLSLFGVVALSLAVMGIHGVMSFAVAERTREIGVRMALGADKGRVLGYVLREGALLGFIGIVAGLATAFAVTRILRGFLFETATTDPRTYIGTVVLLGIAALVATWIPARRAASVDPMVALRKG